MIDIIRCFNYLNINRKLNLTFKYEYFYISHQFCVKIHKSHFTSNNCNTEVKYLNLAGFHLINLFVVFVDVA